MPHICPAPPAHVVVLLHLRSWCVTVHADMSVLLLPGYTCPICILLLRYGYLPSAIFYHLRILH